MRRTLMAAASAFALAATMTFGVVPATADPDDPPQLPSLDPEDKITEPLAAADGPVTAFVQLNTPSALDVVEAGGNPAEAESAAADVEGMAADVVPSQISARTAQSDTPQRLSVTDRLVSGTVVTGEADQIRALASSDDVVAVYLVPLAEPMNKGADVFTRAADVWESYGQTGEGIRMGVIDTGVDYTHAAFGGAGTEEAYAEAYGQDGTGPVPEHLFDEAKYLGGWDFAGPRYDASGTIPGTTPVPQPNPNPIDAPFTRAHSGHGTHVAGSAAAYGVTPDGETFRGDYGSVSDISDWQVGPGSAPEAGIYALKVFGDYGGSTALTINALEWAADPDGDMSFNNLDVVNLSLGSSTAPVDNPQNLFVDRLSELGTLSVMAAGNDGDATDVGGSPGNATSALSVANSIADAMSFDAVEVTGSADESLLGLHAAQNTVFYEGTAGAEGPVVHLGDGVDGCAPLNDYADQVDGNIIWLHWDDNDATRGCGSGAMWENATAAGATGVLIGTGEPVFTAGIAGDEDTPGAQLTARATERLLPEIQDGTLEVAFGPDYAGASFAHDDSVADLLNPGSSRGVHGTLGVVKPDVAAPGTRISSAASAAGSAAHALTGTSMAAPHVAGIGALMIAAKPDRTPQQIKAGIMNTATHDVYSQAGPQGPIYGPERVGAGRVDTLNAVDNGIIAYDSENPDLVSVAFGVVDVSAEQVVLERTITVENVDNPRGAVQLRPRFEAATTTGGATITTSPSRVVVPPGRSQDVTVTLTADPQTLEREIDPTSEAMSLVGVPREYVAALSGQIVFDPPGNSHMPLHVPVHAAPRLVSDIDTEPLEFGADEFTAELEHTGRHVDSGGWTSLTSVLELVATSPALDPVDELETSPTQVAAGDLRYVGAMSTAPALAELGLDPSAGYVGVGMAMEGEWPTLGTTTVPVIDTDVTGDGSPDLQTIVQKYDASTDVTLAVTVDLRSGAQSLMAVNGMWGDVDTTVYDNNVLVAPIPLSLFDPEDEPTFTVWTHSSYAPSADGVIDSVEPFTYDPFDPDVWTTGGSLNNVWSPSTADITVHLSEDAGTDPELLVLHSHNEQAERAQVVDLTVPETAVDVPASNVEGESTSAPEPESLRSAVPVGMR